MVILESTSVTKKLNEVDKTVHYLKIAKAGSMEFKEMCELIALRTTLTAAEVEFALAEVRTVIIENLRIGRGTQLGPLGSVDISVESESKPTEQELSIKNIRRMKLIFKPSVQIKKALKSVQYRIRRIYPKNSGQTE